MHGRSMQSTNLQTCSQARPIRVRRPGSFIMPSRERAEGKYSEVDTCLNGRVIRCCAHIWNALTRSQICLKAFCTSSWIWLAPRLGAHCSELTTPRIDHLECGDDGRSDPGMWRRHAPLTGVYGNSNCMFHPATRPCKPVSGRKNFKAVMQDRRRPFHNSINWMPNARVAFLAHLSLVPPRFVGLELLAWDCLETRTNAYSVSEPSFRVRKCNMASQQSDDLEGHRMGRV